MFSSFWFYYTVEISKNFCQSLLPPVTLSEFYRVGFQWRFLGTCKIDTYLFHQIETCLNDITQVLILQTKALEAIELSYCYPSPLQMVNGECRRGLLSLFVQIWRFGYVHTLISSVQILTGVMLLFPCRKMFLIKDQAFVISWVFHYVVDFWNKVHSCKILLSPLFDNSFAIKKTMNSS